MDGTHPEGGKENLWELKRTGTRGSRKMGEGRTSGEARKAFGGIDARRTQKYFALSSLMVLLTNGYTSGMILNPSPRVRHGM